MKVLFYAINGIGLGHLNKMILVAKEVRALRPDWSILFITNSDFTEWLSKEKFQYIKLPLNDKDLVLTPGQKILPLHYYTQFAMRAIDIYRPEAIVYDASFPGDVVSHAASLDIKNVYVMRKDKDKHLLTILSWQTLEKFSYICMPYSEKEFIELGATKEILDALKKKNVEFVGPIVKEAASKNKKKEGFSILVTAGGGGWHDTKELLTGAYEACKKLVLSRPDISCKIITGPLFNGNMKSDIDGITIEKLSNEFPKLLANSDLVISQAGYSSCNEIILAKTPAVLFPGFRFNEDTLRRAKRLEKKGVAITLKKPQELNSLLPNLFDNNEEKLRQMQRRFSSMKIVPGNKKLAGKIVKLAERTCYVDIDTNAKMQNGTFDNVVFTGSNLNRAKKLAALAKKRKFKIKQLHSNSEKLSSENEIKLLSELGINSYQIDFYGSRAAIHNSLIKRKNNFAHMVLALRLIVRRKSHLVVSCVVLAENQKDAPRLVRLLFELGVFHVNLVLDSALDISQEMILIRKITSQPQFRSRIITFSRSEHAPETLHAKRYYQAMIDYHSFLLSRIIARKETLMARRGLKQSLIDNEKKLESYRKRLITEYAANNEIESGMYAIDEKIAGITANKNKERIEEINLSIRDLRQKKSDLLEANKAKVADYAESSIPDITKSLLIPLSKIDASLIKSEKKLAKILGRKNLAMFKELQQKRASINENLRKHYNEKIRWLKKRIIEIISERETLLKKSPINSILAKLSNKQKSLENEISILKKKRDAM